MATQLLTIATVAGDAGAHVAKLFQSWRNKHPTPETVDQFCERLRANGSMLPVIYFAEWIDRWLMGDQVPGPEPIEGRRFQVAVFMPQSAVKWAEECGTQFPEECWLAARLREAATGWDEVTVPIVVVLREVLGATSTNDEVRDSLRGVPVWLSDV